jgi:predicted SnoaL-like aldol condensation-catalyzing enzyme
MLRFSVTQKILGSATLAVLGCVSLASCTKEDHAVQQDDHAAQTAASRQAVEGFARYLFIEHDAAAAFSHYFADDLIQHDAEIGNGSHGDESFLETRREENPEKYLPTNQYSTIVDNILADGDLVAIKSHVFTNENDPGRVFVDIWQVKDGKFVEHWDVIQPVAQNPKHGNTMWCGKGATYGEGMAIGDTVKNPTCGAPDPSADRAETFAVVEAYRKLLAEPGRIDEAVEKYIAEDYVQHSPHIPDGRGAIAPYFTEGAASRQASARTAQLGRVLVDGDFALYHRLVTSEDNPRGTAYADLFQVKNGKIVAHWDVIQPVPPFTVNGNSMVVGPLEPGRVHGGPADVPKE